MPLSAKEMSEVACTLYEKANAAGEVPEGGRMAFIIGVGWAMQELDLRAQSARIAELEDATDIAIERIAELESQLEAIGAGGVEPLRKPAAAQQAVPASVIAGAVFDFAGYLTTLPHKEAIHCSEAHEAAPMVEAITEWCKRRNLTTDGAKVETWRDHLAEAPAHPAEGVPAQCPNINEPRGCWRVACQLGGKCREPERSATQPAAQGMDAAKLLAEKHTGMKVDYRGLLGQVRRAIKRTAGGHEEMLRQLEGHITELGQRWYAGDTDVVDELLQLYCVEREARAALAAQAKQGGAA